MILQHCQALTEPASRIISLVPSQTELLHSLGLRDEVIGITKFCVHPHNWYQSKIRVGGTKAIDIQKIILLKPDLIIANKEENVKDQVEALAEKFPVWLTDVNTLEEAYGMVSDLGVLTARTVQAKTLISEIKIAFEHFQPATATPAAYLIWKDPYMVAGGGTFINDMMREAGFTNVFANQLRYPQVSVDDLAAAAPEVILLSSEPYPFSAKHVKELSNALPGRKVLLVDGEIFSWYGSRLLLTPAYFRDLARRIHNTPQ